mmetsp:Transcript_5252/g.16064  ORF Transcript_5252/g.16064 Transcript_5252/m.16064 type:complete len:90 (-) Transcript_5252:1187-1456(-)
MMQQMVTYDATLQQTIFKCPSRPPHKLAAFSLPNEMNAGFQVSTQELTIDRVSALRESDSLSPTLPRFLRAMGGWLHATSPLLSAMTSC